MGGEPAAAGIGRADPVGTRLSVGHEAPPAADACADPSADPSDVIARLRFRPAADGTAAAPADDPWLVPLPLAVAAPVDEVWRASRPCVAGRTGDLVWRGNTDVLFGALRVADDEPIEAATLAAYAAVMAAVEGLGDYRIVRLWNYLSRIHGEAAGTDRYGLFCRGRHQALAGRLADFERRLPAASAIGSDRPGLVIHVLASRAGGLQIENPRQVSAFHYPPEYAPRSPSFSRSVLTREADGRPRLYVSGTASIVGHRTRHPHHLAAQLEETCANLDQLLASAARAGGGRLGFRLLRVYLRGGADADAVRRTVAARLGDCPLVVLTGDICRRDLLVEIEGIAEPAEPAAAPG